MFGAGPNEDREPGDRAALQFSPAVLAQAQELRLSFLRQEVVRGRLPPRLDVFSNALSYMAGYGLKAYLITQDIRQIVDPMSIGSQTTCRSVSACSRCSTAEVSLQPVDAAVSIAVRNRSLPYCLPSYSRPIICFVPRCLPCRFISACQISSKLSGHSPARRCCSSGRDPARAPGFRYSTSR